LGGISLKLHKFPILNELHSELGIIGNNRTQIFEPLDAKDYVNIIDREHMEIHQKLMTLNFQFHPWTDAITFKFTTISNHYSYCVSGLSSQIQKMCHSILDKIVSIPPIYQNNSGLVRDVAHYAKSFRGWQPSQSVETYLGFTLAQICTFLKKHTRIRL